jgi:hypothetical protein
MGGFGSGRPPAPSARGLVESCLVLDINALLRKGVLRPGTLNMGPLLFSGPRHLADGSFWYDLLDDMELRVHVQHPKDRSESATIIRVERSLSSLGLVRFWFRCPLSDRRVAKLYLPPGGGVFASREAHGLAYRSQRLSPIDRAGERVRRIHKRLGGKGAVMRSFPERPRGMHERTYARLRAKALRAKELIVADMAAELERIKRRSFRTR